MKRFLLLAVFASVGMIAVALVLLLQAEQTSSRNIDAAHVHAGKGALYLQEHLYRAAIEEFEAAARKSPRALDPWVGLAAVYIRLGDGNKALEGAGKAVTIANDSADAQIILGRAHWLARNLAEAETAALKARDLAPSRQHATELLLNIYFERQDKAKFQETYDSITKPNRPIQDLVVRFAVRRGEFQKAYDLQTQFDRSALETESFRYELALKREPARVELYPPLVGNLVRLGRANDAIALGRMHSGEPLDLEIGKAYWLAGNRDEAIRAFERASSAGTHKLSAEVALAAITGDLRHWREAFRAEWIEKDHFILARLEALLETASPLQKAFTFRYAGLFDNELFARSAEEALGVLKSEPDQFDALMILGTAYLRLGRFDDAMRYVQQAADRHPDRAEVWARLGQLKLAKGDANAAAPLMEKGIRLEPSNPSYLYNYAWLLDQLDRDGEAVPHYQRAIAASPLSFESMNNLALIESEAGNLDRAMVLLNRAIAANPANEMAYMNRGNYHAAQRSWSDALADYTRASELNPLNGLAALEMGRIHLELDRADIAIEELNVALEMDPNLRDAYLLLSSAYKKKGREHEAAAAQEEAKHIKDPR